MTKPLSELKTDIAEALERRDYQLVDFYIDTRDSELWELDTDDVIEIAAFIYVEIGVLNAIPLDFRASIFVGWLKSNLSEEEIIGFYSLIPLIVHVLDIHKLLLALKFLQKCLYLLLLNSH